MVEHLEKYFQELYEALGHGNHIDEFTLEEYGYLIVLEGSDNISEVLDAWPEYVEIETLKDGSQFYKIAVLYTNESMCFYYAEVGQLDEEVENTLKQFCTCTV